MTATPIPPDRAEQELTDLEELCSEVSGLPLLTTETADEIVGYEDDGSLAETREPTARPAVD